MFLNNFHITFIDCYLCSNYSHKWSKGNVTRPLLFHFTLWWCFNIFYYGSYNSISMYNNVNNQQYETLCSSYSLLFALLHFIIYFQSRSLEYFRLLGAIYKVFRNFCSNWVSRPEKCATHMASETHKQS